MKRKGFTFSTLVIFTLLLLFLLRKSNEVIEVVLLSMEIFKNNLFPVLFPFFVLSQLMSEYGVVDFLGELMKNICGRIFKMKKEIAFPFLFSMISGFPSGAKYTSMLYQENRLTRTEANQLLGFTHFANPAFILGTVGSAFLGNTKLAFFIFLAHLSGGILTGIFIGRKNTSPKREKVSIRKAFALMHKKQQHQEKTLGQVLTSSISNAIENLLSILGTITFFMIIAKFIVYLIPLPMNMTILLKGILEMTQGIQAASVSAFSLFAKGILITLFISFGGISVHMQVVSMISKTNLAYSSYFKARMIHCLFASLLFSGLYFIVF